MAKVKKSKKIQKNPLLLVLVVMVVVGAVVTLGWILFKELYAAGNKITVENSENVVVNNVGAPSSLTSAILSEKAGCNSVGRKKNVVYIDKFTNTFALVRYGCNLDANAFYKKENNRWVMLSPTNEFIGNIPLCAYVKENAIPEALAFSCYDGTPTSDGKLPPLVANPVKS